MFGINAIWWCIAPMKDLLLRWFPICLRSQVHIAGSCLWWCWTRGVGVLMGSLSDSGALQASIWLATVAVFRGVAHSKRWYLSSS